MKTWDPLWSELSITWPHAVYVVVSAVCIYVAFMVLVRLFGQRVLTGLSTFDAVLTIMLGAVAGRVILGDHPTLLSGILGLVVLFGLEGIFGTARQFLRGHRLINNPVTLLMIGPEIQEHALKRAHITRAELMATLRGAGIRSFEEVACVFHESSGSISVLKAGEPIDPLLLQGVRGADRLPGELLA